MSLHKRKVSCIIVTSLMCGVLLTGCNSNKAKQLSIQPTGEYQNADGTNVDVYDIRAIERDINKDKEITVDKIDKYTKSLSVDIYKELKKGLDKANKNYINERLLLMKDLQSNDIELQENVASLMRVINKDIKYNSILEKSRYYDKYVLESLKQLQTDPYDLLVQINENDKSVREVMMDSLEANFSSKQDTNLRQDIENYKAYCGNQLNIVTGALNPDVLQNVSLLDDTVIQLKSNLLMLELSGNTNRQTRLYEDIMLNEFENYVAKYDASVRKVAILKEDKHASNKVKQEAMSKVNTYQNKVENSLRSMQYEYSLDKLVRPTTSQEVVK
ncbi:hypothetical protein UT300012_22590 [Paraclostridium bifermentans]